MMMHRTGNLTFWRAAIACVLLLANTAMASLSVTVDRTQISDADLLKLTVRVENATTAVNPDFTALQQDFEIVQRSGPNQSSRISIINGRQTSEVYVSWELRLRPKRLGSLTIPAFRIGSDTSQPISIQVSKQSEAMKRKMSQLVFFDTSVDTSETYVQGQIIYTIKLYYVENISGDFPPVPSIPDAVVETIEGEKRYDAITNGRRYYVLEKRYGIYPQKSGELRIPAQTFSGYRVASGFFSTREPILTRSESHDITVKAKPAEFPGDHWLPATRVSLEETWVGGSPNFTVGEPVNRSIVISASGVAASLLPALPATEIEGAKTYQDPPDEEQSLTSEGIDSTQTIVIGIVPTQPGTLRLPKIEIPWWNTKTDQLELATIPAQTFNVAPSPRSQVSAPPIQESNQLPTPVAPTAISPANPYWQYSTFGLIALWLVTLLLWFTSSRGQPKTALPAQPVAPGRSELLKQLKGATAKNDAGETQRLLIQWGNAKYGNVHSLQALIRQACEPDLAAAIGELETAFYAPDASRNWQGKHLWQAVQKADKVQHQSASKTQLVSGLNPG